LNVPNQLKSFLDDVLLKAVSEVGEGVILLDFPRIIYSNEAFCEITGFSEEELLSLPSFFDMVPPDKRADIQEKISSHLKSRKVSGQFETVIQGKTGKLVDIELTLNHIKGNPQSRIVSIVRNVTEQKKMEEVLVHQGLQYKLLFHSNPNPMWIYDLETLGILAVNAAAVQKYGYSERQFLSLTLKDLRAPEELPDLLTQIGKLKENLSVIKETVQHRLQNGSLIDVEVISHPIDFEGRRARVVMVTDMTDNKKAQSALRESEERLKTVLTSAPIALFAMDRNGLFTLAEGRALKELRLGPGQVVGRSAFDIYRENPKIIQSLRRSLAGENFVIRMEEGQAVFETHFSPVRNANGEVVEVIGIAMDVTERRRMETALRQRVEFEKLITTLSSHFINLPPPMVDAGIRNALQSIGQFIEVDRIRMFFKNQGRLRGPVFEWQKPGVHSPVDANDDFILSDYPWFSEKLKATNVLYISSPEDLPEEASAERNFLQLRGIQSMVAVPLFSVGSPIGILTFSSLRAKKTWTEEDIALFKITGEMFASAVVRRQNEEALRGSEEKFRVLFNNAIDSIFLFTISEEGIPDKFVEVNDIACVKLGYSREDLLGMTFSDISNPEDLNDLPKVFKKLIQQGHLTFEKATISKTGLKIPAEISAHVFQWCGQRFVQAIARDITDRKRAEETIRRQAYYDVLTNLPNRTLFKDRLEQAMKHAHRNKQMLGVIVLDLDRFKNINETLGHVLGDKLLVAVAERLLGVLNESETIARFGGDEFTLLLPQVTTIEEATRHAQKIIELLGTPFRLNNHDLHVTTSIGMAFYPDDGENYEILLKNAETAMYRAKEQGRNNYQLYASVMNVSAFKQLLMENSLRRALEKEEFVVYYQPQIDLKTQRMTGAEALVRWQHPDLGLVFPTEFIGLAEETGLIVPIGEWVIRKVCSQNKKWQDAGYGKVCVSVNLSARQFQQRNLVATISQILQETGLDPQYLGMEITETIAMKNADYTISALNELKKMHVHLSLDDFGTGYSSLSYLKRFPLETLKIDRSFVRDITTDPNDAAIVTAVVALAHSLKLDVVAEGVETDGQLTFLKGHQCDQVQGYIFSHPLSEENFIKTLKQNPPKA
jgi:diguanylate cyclase (GGDEF)-like protein/PAS domain S-box-containing protein